MGVVGCTIVRKLIDSKFYCRYIDDTLVLVKPSSIPEIINEFHKFHRNIHFTFDAFESTNPHFLDIDILQDGLCVHRKNTFTGLHQL